MNDTGLSTEATSQLAQKPGRFSLRELLILTTLVCIAAAMIAWTRRDQDVFPLAAFSVVICILFTLRMLLRSSVEVVICTLVLLVIAWLLMPSPNPGWRTPARRMQCSNHLKQIGLALQNYHDVYGCLPPAYIADASGRPIHSWRVLILPFMEQKPLYDKYNFNESWDGPNNRKLHYEIVAFYCCPSDHGKKPSTETSYVAVVGAQTAWPGDKTVSITDITDATSDTVLVVETAASGIHWMEPRDLHVTQMPMAINAPGQGISSAHPNVALACFVDGHTQALTNDLSPNGLWGVLTIAGGEPLDPILK